MIRKKQNEWESISRKRKIDNNSAEVKKDERKRKNLSRNKQREADPVKVKENQLKWQMKSRLINTEKKRLNRFREQTKSNSISVADAAI